MRTISRIKPSVPPPIQYTSPSIGVINALIVFFLMDDFMPSVQSKLVQGRKRLYGVKPLQLREKLR
jgi:hypothetical protein